jgi:predicted Zn-dependent protease
VRSYFSCRSALTGPWVSLALGVAFLRAPASVKALSSPNAKLAGDKSVAQYGASVNSKTAMVTLRPQNPSQPSFGAEGQNCLEAGGNNNLDRALLLYGKPQPGVLYVLAEAMMRSRRYADADRLFRALLELDPGSVGGRLGLGGALAASGCYVSALQTYNEVLRQQPSNYAALQGEAFVLLWTGHLRKAWALFHRLAQVRPDDAANLEALSSLSRASDLQHWKAMRPPEGAPPGALLAYDISYLADHPTDEAALTDLIKSSAQLQYFDTAIRLERRAIEADPHDVDIQIALANLLAWNREYGPAIVIYQRMLAQTPDDRGLLESLARTYDWSRRPKDSLRIEQELSAQHPANEDYQLAIVRLDLRLHNNDAAQNLLTSFLRAHPGNREARLDLAGLDVQQSRFVEAGREYDVLLGENFQDPGALYGAARIAWYMGDPRRALPLARNLVDEQPKNFEALLLLARIELALHQRKAALVALKQASALSPDNKELAQVKSQSRAQTSISLQTSAYYAREVSFSNPLVGPSGAVTPGAQLEDLNSYGASTRLGFQALPRTASYVLASITPTNSPFGGIQGAAAPAEILYGQTTRVSHGLTLRGGLGLVRMGPGEILGGGENHSTPIPTTGLLPLGYIGFSLSLTPKLAANFTLSHEAITYTPVAVRLGVRQTRIEGGLRYDFDSRTRLGATLFHDSVASPLFYLTSSPGPYALFVNGHDSGNGASLTLTRTVLRAAGSSLDIGYDGLAFGYGGQLRGVFMGFFNPTLYERHFIAAEASGRLWRSFRYDLVAALGVQRTDPHQPFTRAEQIGPGLTVSLGERSSVSLRYVHYNFAQSLGALMGNAIELSTDYRF